MTGECAGCGKPRPENAGLRGWRRGWCGACGKRWRRHGKPADGPPPPAPRGNPRAPWANRISRIEDYADLRSWGVPDSEAAERLGVSARTLTRYKQAMQEVS
jgi:hypothetical protein